MQVCVERERVPEFVVSTPNLYTVLDPAIDELRVAPLGTVHQQNLILIENR